MASMIALNLRPDARTLRQFGFIALAGFSFLALIAWKDWLIFSFGLGAAKPWVAGMSLGLGLLAGLFSLVWPAANRPIYVGLTLATFPIGFVLSHVIMVTLFYLVIAPIGLILRVLGRDPLSRKLDPSASSYWVDVRRERPRESYFKQF